MERLIGNEEKKAKTGLYGRREFAGNRAFINNGYLKGRKKWVTHRLH
jgi:hypothetical protein